MPRGETGAVNKLAGGYNSDGGFHRPTLNE